MERWRDSDAQNEVAGKPTKKQVGGQVYNRILRVALESNNLSVINQGGVSMVSTLAGWTDFTSHR
jgi:hypothetical protein